MDEFSTEVIFGSTKMSSERQAVSVRDLVDEAKKRIVFLVTCVVGLSYLMSCEYICLHLHVFLVTCAFGFFSKYSWSEIRIG